MFSAQDIRDIFHSLPPKDAGHDSLLGPSLLLSSNEQEFITTNHAFREFEDIVSTTEQAQLSTTDLSKALEIEPDAVLRFARASPGLVLLTRDNNIIPKTQRALIAQRLQELLAHELVYEPDFARHNDISSESMDALVEAIQIENTLKGGLNIFDGYLASEHYRISVSEAIHRLLNESLRENKSTEISSKTLPGNPPHWYVKQLIAKIMEDTQMSSEFHVTDNADTTICTPRDSVLRKRNAIISALPTGEIPFLDMRNLLEEFHETFKSMYDVETYLSAIPEIEIHGHTAISKTWLDHFGNACVDAVKILGYADLTSKITDTFPPPTHAALIHRLETHIEDSFSRSNTELPLHKAGDYLVTSSRYDSDRALLLQSAQTNALHQWTNLKNSNNTDTDLKFKIDDIFDFIPQEQTILRALSDDKKIRKEVEETYWSEISRLESSNEAEFEKFWLERVVSRTRNYEIGLHAITDTKLRGQLAELLEDYLEKEFISASLTKARSKSLLLSRRTRRNVGKLESGLEKLFGPYEALGKFNAKQNIPKPSREIVETTKKVMVDDLARWMQKRSDGPTLFLTLVVVLLAKSGEGVVYATGKFAPKLMKMLKGKLSAEKYERLEKWKDETKKGVLTEEDKEGMKGWVLEADRQAVEELIVGAGPEVYGNGQQPLSGQEGGGGEGTESGQLRQREDSAVSPLKDVSPEEAEERSHLL